jgi:5,10-methylenetetrahydromethanopterin reductase
VGVARFSVRGNMNKFDFFTSTAPLPGKSARAAQRAESDGWTGLTFTDSQSLGGDPYVAMTAAALATTSLRLATGVTNPLTRHAAVTATAVTSVDIESEGRVELGIGRGDSSLAHIGLVPAPVEWFVTYLTMLRSYLRGESVSIEEARGAATNVLGDTLPLHDAPSDSRLRWLRANYKDHTPVPVFVVASGPRVIKIAAELGDRVLLAVGGQPERVRWGVDLARSANPDVPIGMYVNVVVDEDIERGVALAAGGVTSFARFSVMHGRVNGPVSEADRSTLEALPGEYQMSKHFQSGNMAVQRGEDLAESFAIVGSATYCIERLQELGELGIDRFHIVGPTRDTDRDASKAAAHAFTHEVLPALSTAQ